MPEEHDIEEIENLLKKMQAVAPSKMFFKNVEAELENTPKLEEIEQQLLKLTPKKPSENFIKRVAKDLEDNTQTFKKHRLIFFPKWISAAAAVGVAALSLCLWQNSQETNIPHYQLVSTESSLSDVQRLPIEAQEDGTLIRPIRYIYTKTNRWEDPKTQKTYIEHRPYEKIVPTLVAVY